MSTSAVMQALLAPDRPDRIPGAALYAAWRSGGSRSVVAMHLMSQLSMGFILFVFYLATSGTDYDQLREHLARPLCPGTVPTTNDAGLFETDCWGFRPIDVTRRPDAAVLAVIVVTLLAMLWEGYVCALTVASIGRAETWWAARDSAAPITEMATWDEVTAAVGGVEVTARSDAFVQIYATTFADFRHVPRTLHNAVGAAQWVHRVTGWSLRTSLAAVGVGAAVGLPYLAVSKACKYVFRNVQAIRTRGVGSVLGRRRWSRIALWRMRSVGEPSHRFEERAAETERLALELIDAIPTPPAVRALANFVLVAGGGVVMYVLLLTLLLNEHVLTANLSPGRTVAFYTTVIGVVLAIAAHFEVAPAAVDVAEIMQRIELRTPGVWDDGTLEEKVALVSQRMPYWFEDAAVEVASLVTTPFHLLVTLPSRARSVSAALADL